MAKLQKLQISGIRSFGPGEDEIQLIKFNDCVTLFLGQNGTGKTTILESIKFGLSGELPAGCSNGQGFVNDPSLTGRMETKGQIRLMITDGNSKQITIIKSVQVLKQRNGKLQFKSLDSSVSEMKEGERKVQFSGRCLDIDNYCCETLQVSKSILNNVLLCHQENSFWPLDEGKKLMEKFDEIFNSVRYNKCVEILRKSCKDRRELLKTLKLELQFKQENKNRIEKATAKLQDKKNDSQIKENTVTAKKNDLDPIKNRLVEINSLEESFGKLEKQLASKEAARNGIIGQQKTIKRNIHTEFTGTDEELKDKIRSFDNDRHNEEKTIKELEKKKVDIENKEKETNLKVQNLQMKMGQLKEEKRQFDHKCVERTVLLDRAKSQMNVSCDINNYEGDNAEMLIDKLRDALESLKEAKDNQMLGMTSDEAELQHTIDTLREKQISMKQNVESKLEILSEYEKKVKDITNHLQDLKVSNSRLETINNKIEDIDKTINSLKKSFNEERIVSEIENYKSQMENMEKKKFLLEQDYRLLQKNSVSLEKMENAKQTIVQKETEINKLKNKHSSNLLNLFPQSEYPTASLKASVESILKEEEHTVKCLQSKINEKQKEVTTLDTKLQSQAEKLKSQESDLRNNQKKVASECKDKNLDELLSKVSKKKESLQRDKALCNSLEVVYGKFIAKFQEEDPCCPICKTNFKNKFAEVNLIVSDLKSEIESVPRKLPKYEQELTKLEDFYNKLQQLKPVNDSITIMSDVEIPLLKENIEELKANSKTAKEELERFVKQMELPQNKIETCKKLITDAAFLDQYHADIEKMNQIIEEVKSQLVKCSSEKSVQEIEAEIDTLNVDIIDARKRIESYKKKLEQHKTRLQDLRECRNKLVEQQLDFQGAVRGQPEKENQLKEYTEKIGVLKSEIVELKGKLQLVNNKLKEALQEKDKVLRNHAKIREEFQNKLALHRKILDDILRLQDSINHYIQEHRADILTSTEDDVTNLTNLQENIKIAKNKIIQTILNKKEDLAKQESKFRELNDNVTLREKEKEVVQLDVEISELKNKIGNHSLTSVHQEKRNLESQYEKIRREINIITGQHDQLKSEIAELEKELNKPASKNAYIEYRNKFYEMVVQNTAVNDLEKYIAALEKSIVEFHKDKMKQVNKGIRELWRNIYRGNDIDYIEIKTEEAASTTKKRSYNYKVVQVKRGTELEMRGRCSAGQKVLACLVIRIALAEIFSAKCGILALDEPTTNLDRENICSLSDAISRIVEHRQQETNFQLLIITHDEDFLDTLRRTQSVANYYRVKRNEQGFSMITKEHL